MQYAAETILELVNKGKGAVKTEAMQTLKIMYDYFGGKMSTILKDLGKFQKKEMDAYIEERGDQLAKPEMVTDEEYNPDDDLKPVSSPHSHFLDKKFPRFLLTVYRL